MVARKIQTMRQDFVFMAADFGKESGWKNQHPAVNGSLSAETSLTLALFHRNMSLPPREVCEKGAGQGWLVCSAPV